MIFALDINVASKKSPFSYSEKPNNSIKNLTAKTNAINLSPLAHKQVEFSSSFKHGSQMPHLRGFFTTPENTHVYGGLSLGNLYDWSLPATILLTQIQSATQCLAANGSGLIPQKTGIAVMNTQATGKKRLKIPPNLPTADLFSVEMDNVIRSAVCKSYVDYANDIIIAANKLSSVRFYEIQAAAFKSAQKFLNFARDNRYAVKAVAK